MTQTAKKIQSPITSADTDPVTGYAQRVVDGDIIAGGPVVDACARHLRDLKEQNHLGIEWSLERAHDAFGYFEHVLRLNGGQFEGAPFLLLDWQLFIVGSLFGWLDRSDGFRRFRMAYVEAGKGSGKSPLAAGIGLKGLTSDWEQRAEIYAAASKKDQAMVLFRDAVAMVDQSPALSQVLQKSGGAGKEWLISYLETNSFFRPIASDGAQSGPRPHIGLLDEIHEHKDGTVVEFMRAGTKFRQQALMFMITNSGKDMTTVCYDYHEYGKKVCSGMLEDLSFFAFICSLDDGDDPFQSEDCWPKANPSLHHGIPGLKYLREQVTQARGMPSKEATVRRLNFCQWVESSNPIFSADVWLGAADKEFDIDQLRGRRCYGGLDLSSIRDLTAFVLMFEPTEEDPVWRQLEFFWVPGDGISEKEELDRVPYVAWEKAGYIIKTPGKTVNKAFVYEKLVELSGMYDIAAVAFDRWRVEELITDMGKSDSGAIFALEEKEIGIPLVKFGQGFKDMSPALEKYEERLLADQLKHSGNPCMTWNAANAVADTDSADNRKPDKRKSTGRIDGIVAAIMASGASVGKVKQKIKSFYDA